MPNSLDQMEKLRAAKYREICEFIARELGIELRGRSSAEARASVREVADQSIEAWDQASVDSRDRRYSGDTVAKITRRAPRS